MATADLDSALDGLGRRELFALALLGAVPREVEAHPADWHARWRSVMPAVPLKPMAKVMRISRWRLRRACVRLEQRGLAQRSEPEPGVEAYVATPLGTEATPVALAALELEDFEPERLRALRQDERANPLTRWDRWSPF